MTKAFVDQLADICEDTANVLLLGDAPNGPDTTPTPYWEADRQAIEAEFGSDEPYTWINACVSTYLSEAANQLLAIAGLLRTETVTATLDSVERSLIERVGAVNWLLEEDKELTEEGDEQTEIENYRTAVRKRVARSGLSFLVSIQFYRDALSGLEGDGPRSAHRTVLKTEQSRISELMIGWFKDHLERPPVDPDDESSKPTKDPTRWKIDGEGYPTFTRLAQLAFQRYGIDARMAAAIYDALSGFTHPNVVFGQEHQNIDGDGHITFTYRDEDLEKSIQQVICAFGDAVKRRAQYYDADPAGVIDKMDAVFNRLGEISVLPNA
jgi:hypothetical protein